MRRIPYIPLAAVLLVLAILCGGCGRSGDAQAGPAVLGAEERAEAAALLDAQLGLLKDEINDTEYERCLAFMETLYPLREWNGLCRLGAPQSPWALWGEEGQGSGMRNALSRRALRMERTLPAGGPTKPMGFVGRGGARQWNEECPLSQGA
ncbi:hypothetical protein GMD73_05660 [Pseudoflavonifractor sp. BIOML-A15]|nr:hypothetical protein [Pseudoflavonifractor sp. BIOML-A15]